MTTIAPAASPATRDRLSVRSGSAPQDRYLRLQTYLFAAGAILMPLGIVIVCLGWYGAAHANYAYDQFPYLISGGFLGMSLAQLGGFLYFGAWLAKGARDQQEGSQQIADTMLVLADVVSRQRAEAANPALAEMANPGAVPVVAGESGTTIHRRDCALIRHRQDLHVLTGTEQGLSPCRVCDPSGI